MEAGIRYVTPEASRPFLYWIYAEAFQLDYR